MYWFPVFSLLAGTKCPFFRRAAKGLAHPCFSEEILEGCAAVLARPKLHFHQRRLRRCSPAQHQHLLSLLIADSSFGNRLIAVKPARRRPGVTAVDDPSRPPSASARGPAGPCLAVTQTPAIDVLSPLAGAPAIGRISSLRSPSAGYEVSHGCKSRHWRSPRPLSYEA